MTKARQTVSEHFEHHFCDHKEKKKKKALCIYTLGGQIHSLDFNSVLETYSLKSAVRGDNTH